MRSQVNTISAHKGERCNAMRTRILLPVFVVLAILGAAVAWRTINFTGIYLIAREYRAQYERPSFTPIQMESSELIDNYQSNKYLADWKYYNKLVFVSGRIKQVILNSSKQHILYLDNGGMNGRIEIVGIFDSRETSNAISLLIPGQDIKVLGSCMGLHKKTIALVGCVITPKLYQWVAPDWKLNIN